AQLLDRPVDRELDRADLRGAELRLSEHVPGRIEDDAGEVERLVEDRRVRRRHHGHAHVAAAAREVVVDHCQGDRAERGRWDARRANLRLDAHAPAPVSTTSAPWEVSSRVIAGSTKTVDPSSSTTAGPSSFSPAASAERWTTTASSHPAPRTYTGLCERS